MPDTQTTDLTAIAPRVTAAVEWLQADSAAVALTLDVEGTFVAVARDGRWQVASNQAEAEAIAEAFGEGFGR